MNNFAPVFIFTLNRYGHLKRCVESLSNCTHANKTELYIALDYPANETHWDGYKKIKTFLHKIRGFKKVIIIKRDENFGAVKNEIEGQREIFRQHDRIITSEDDNEFSPNFLDYINKGLDKFEDDDNVTAICGYLYPLKIKNEIENNYFKGKAFSAWGFGMWRHKVLHNNPYSEKELKSIIKDRDLISKLKYFDHRKYYLIHQYIKKNIIPYGDRSVVIDIIVNDKSCVFPTRSKVKNYGHDGSGMHCGVMEDDIYTRQEIDANSDFEYVNTNENDNMYMEDKLRKFFKVPNKTKVKEKIKYILSAFGILAIIKKYTKKMRIV